MQRLWLVLVVMALVIAACGGDGESGSSDASEAGTGEPRQVPIGAADGGTIIEVAVGDELIVDLGGNPSTGYSWVNESPATSVLVEQGEPEFITDSELIAPPGGVSGIMRCRFDAVEPGTAQLELAYRRPWEEDVEPERWFSVTVVVEQ